jgi:hypothetical protein
MRNKTLDSFPQQNRPVTMAPHGLVASPHYLASQAGVEILKKGGSAVDAAIATNAVLNVVYPHMCGIGGDAFWLIYGVFFQSLFLGLWTAGSKSMAGMGNYPCLTFLRQLSVMQEKDIPSPIYSASRSMRLLRIYLDSLLPKTYSCLAEKSPSLVSC